MTSIWDHGRPWQERTSEGLLGSSPPPESSHDETLINPPAEPLIAKYTEEDLQKILKTVLKAQACPSDGPRKKALKARSPDVYCSKFNMECYNFCQQYNDHFATAGAKSLNRTLFATSSLRDSINFH